MNRFEKYVDKQKIEALLAKKDEELAKLYKLLGKKVAVKEEEEEEKKFNVLLWVLAIIGVVAAVAGICYAIYRYFTPDYLDDFDDDFDEEFDEIEAEEDEDDDSLYEDEE
ncbi:MAG: hypothetical protein IK081_06570 [Lachnospiraceae bacterium]|nr:hypothetical protein [Lachnospiraceae bacterium]